jgi:hypothetical protein
MITIQQIKDFSSYASFCISYGNNYMSQSEFYQLKLLVDDSIKFYNMQKEIERGRTILTQIKDIEDTIDAEASLKIARKYDMPYSSYARKFQSAVDEAQYLKCISCKDFEKCIYEHDCLRKAEYTDPNSLTPSPNITNTTTETCQKALNAVMKQIEKRDKQVIEYAKQMENWMKEYNKLLSNEEVHPADKWTLTSTSFLSNQDKRVYIAKLGYNPDEYIISSFVMQAPETPAQLMSPFRNYKVVLRMLPEIYANKLSELNIRKPTQPMPLNDIIITCVDCSNNIDISQVGTMTNSFIQQYNQCIVDIKLKKEADEKKKKELDELLNTQTEIIKKQAEEAELTVTGKYEKIQKELEIIRQNEILSKKEREKNLMLTFVVGAGLLGLSKLI